MIPAHQPSPAPTSRGVASLSPSSSAAPSIAAANTAAPNYVPPGTDQASAIVRSYLGAIARGDRSTATSYLSHGLPSEGFMDSSSRILSVRSQSTGSQQYKVTADVATSTGEYYITFTVEPGPGGLQITDHYSIKTQ
jgi:hypothetical protein